MLSILLTTVAILALVTAEDQEAVNEVRQAVNKRMPQQYPPPPPPDNYINIKPDYSGYLSVANGRVIDTYGHEIIFRGVNLDNKKSPQYFTQWNTKLSGQTYSEGERFIRKIVSMGFNAIRLGVHWESIETSAGSYSSTYIQKIKDVFQTCNYYRIKVLLDFHQDGWCGMSNLPTGYEGMPTWAQSCSGSCPESGQNQGSGPCSNLLEASQYNKKYINDWDRFWKNTNSIQTRFHSMVTHVVNQLSTYHALILGIEDINEPVFDNDTWDCYDDYNVANTPYDVSGNSDPVRSASANQYYKGRQGRMDEHHRVNTGKEIYGAGGSCDTFYSSSGRYKSYATAFNNAVNAASYGTNYIKVFNSLITERIKYVPTERFQGMGSTSKSMIAKSFYYKPYMSATDVNELADKFNTVAANNGRAALITEWGAAVNPSSTDSDRALDAFDKEKLHAFYYAFKHTSGTNDNYDIMTDDSPASYSTSVIGRVERPYARKICGTLTEFTFTNSGTNKGKIIYKASRTNPAGTLISTSCRHQIWMPTAIYPNGYTVSGCNQASSGDDRVLEFYATSAASVSCTITKN